MYSGIREPSFQRYRPYGGADETQLREALSNLGRLYRRTRIEEDPSLPPLDGLRLYEVHWTLSRGLENLDRPDSRRLVVEVATDRSPIDE